MPQLRQDPTDHGGFKLVEVAGCGAEAALPSAFQAHLEERRDKRAKTNALRAELACTLVSDISKDTLVDNRPEESRIVQEEPFGPILPVLKWRDEDEVVARANASPFGLGASVWGSDLVAVERIGARLDAGTVWLNELRQYWPHQAFGGHKRSGIGCENSLHGLMECANWKTITLNREAAFVQGV